MKSTALVCHDFVNKEKPDMITLLIEMAEELGMRR